ncbi:hypothetical protein [Stakelama tenebrarum]|uniref:Uncharacterized protein n=1 Tax=Stakelama tenebrarum TaxID=2711215 RepID=A0A6G6Y6W5_9SPHN|nr:hypothetical protein [Sphingosinithalassobacter tenebrarum]QIG80591.1 hypothetical protein G5C33_12905 [Sphingosinithalassobacter tenebrarum]
MKPTARKWRIAIILALAIAAAYVAWRSQGPQEAPCEPGREEVKDDSGNVVEIRTVTCFD